MSEETKLSVLFARWRNLTSKERNEELEILFGGILADIAEGGNIKPADLELLRALQRSFGISLRWAELNKGGDEGF